MKAIASLLFALALFAQTLPTTIMHPARLMFYSIYPTNTQTQDKLFFILSETNDYEKEPTYYLDYELTALTIIVQKKIGPNSSIRFIAPFYYIWGGFLDAPLDLFHNATGTLHGYRHNDEGKNRVHLFYAAAYKSTPFATLGNFQIEFKHRFKALGLNQAFIYGIKLPTATKNSGFGNKKAAAMIGWVTEKGAWNLGLWLAYNPRFTLPQARSKRLHYFATVSWSHGNWLIDYRFASSPFTSTFPQYDSISNIVDVAYTKGNWRFFISENLSPFYNSPDLTLGVVYKF